MTAVVLREQAKSARVTGTVGALVVALAFAMMVLTAPSHPRQRPPVPAGLSEWCPRVPSPSSPSRFRRRSARCSSVTVVARTTRFLLLSQYLALTS